MWIINSTRRYTDNHYNLLANSYTNFIVSFLFFPIFWTILLRNIEFKSYKNYECEKVVIDCNHKFIYEKFFSNTFSFVDSKKITRLGDGLDVSIDKKKVLFSDFLKLFILSIILWPFVTILSLFFRKNYFQGVARSLIVYFRSLNFFRKLSCNIYITYEDNKCSPAFYEAFKKSKGKYLIAFQNGFRVFKNGLAFTYIDHYFSNTFKNIMMCKKYNGLIKNYSLIDPIFLTNYPEFKTKRKSKHDIVFIDQSEDVSDFLEIKNNSRDNGNYKFLKHIKKFSNLNKNLKLFFCLRNKYSKKELAQIQDFFSDTKIVILEKNNQFSSYKLIQESKLIVTNYSTIGIEGLFMQIPVLFTNHLLDNEYSILDNNLFQLKCDNYKLFDSAISLILKDHSTREKNLQNIIKNITYDNSREIIKNTFNHYYIK